MVGVWQRRLAAAALGLVTAGSFVAPSSPARASLASAELAGSQGTDTRLPPTPSQLTVNGRGAFAGLAVTVNQTGSLNNQAVSVSWTGGSPTLNGPFAYSGNFMQIMQCWGDDDGSVPGNPGPPPEQCIFGAAGAKYGGGGGTLPPGLTSTRIIARTDWANFSPTVGVADFTTSNVWRKFRSVTGDEVGVHIDSNFNPAVGGAGFWLNPFFNIITTNEVSAAATRKDGTGEALIEVQTGVESTGLGCGQRVVPQLDGSKAVPKCWLVVVPRGTPTAENVNTAFQDGANDYGVSTSPLSPAAWANRIAIPIEFNPVDSPCEIGADERRLVGTELALRAIANWQPSLCLAGGLPPYSFAPASDATARQQLTSGSFGAPRMVAVSRPIAPDQIDAANPVVYSPLAISGITIGFNIERIPLPNAGAAFEDVRGERVARMNLTPRLVAKLLTQSYRGAVTYVSQAPPYTWLPGNPLDLGRDPDFVQFNPEFAKLAVSDPRTFSGLVVPAGNSDAAQQLWQWIFADAEALAFLKGTPDPWGMKVNPAYAATAALNTLGSAFGTPMPNSFPKAEPYCYQAPGVGDRGTVIPPPMCGTDWFPYSRGFSESARIGRVAYDGAKINLDPFALSTNGAWKSVTPQGIGERAMLVVTDTPSASLFGLQTAALSRAGDDGADRVFTTPTSSSLLSAVSAMTSPTDQTVLEPPTSGLPVSAYPLATVTYAASTPVAMTAQERIDYAAFLEYAVGAGQNPGPDLGQLPAGYAPLTQALKDRAATAIVKVRTLQAPAPTTTTTPTTRPTYRPPVTYPTYPDYSTPDYTVPIETVPTESVPVDGATTTTIGGPTTTTSSASTTTVIPAAVVTPRSPSGRGRFAVVVLGVMVLGSALAALEITKRPRRRPASLLVEPSLEGASQ